MASDFDRLEPQLILHAVEAAGFRPTGEYSQLNSYENRVFDLRLESASLAEATRVIAKFYRPQRWSRAAIHDEHSFLQDLAREAIPAVAPLQLANGATTLEMDGFLMAIFPRVLGRSPQEFVPGELQQVGRTLARIHNVGSRHLAQHRPTLNAETYGWKVLERLEKWVYPELWRRYQETATVICQYLDAHLPDCAYLRIHGDCHKGNLLHSSGGEFFFVDFDDFCNGPVVQDFWMLLSGSLGEDEAAAEQDQICEGYAELRALPEDDWHLFEPLRGLRIISYAGWIAQRWSDKSFQRLFPDYESYNYWLEELRQLENIAREL